MGDPVAWAFADGVEAEGAEEVCSGLGWGWWGLKGVGEWEGGGRGEGQNEVVSGGKLGKGGMAIDRIGETAKREWKIKSNGHCTPTSI